MPHYAMQNFTFTGGICCPYGATDPQSTSENALLAVCHVGNPDIIEISNY